MKINYNGFGVHTTINCPNANITSFGRLPWNFNTRDNPGTLKVIAKSFSAYIAHGSLSELELHIKEPFKQFRFLPSVSKVTKGRKMLISSLLY